MPYPEMASHYSTDTKAASSYFKREFQLLYQPVVALQTQGLHSFETFVAWQQERAQLYAPNVLALVEQSNLDLTFHQWVFYEACRQLKFWQTYCLADVPLCLTINLSARQLACPKFVKSIREVIHELRVDPAHLQLEIPAQWTLQNSSAAKSTISQLKRVGVSICVDDFELSGIACDRLDCSVINTLKINANCIRQLPDDEFLSERFQKTISITDKQNVKVIPQGIELPSQLETVMGLGAVYGQGDLFLPPVIAREATTLISAQVENQPKELMAYLIAMNALSQFAQQFLGKTLVSRYWKETKPQKPWLTLLEPYSDRSRLLSSTRSTKLNVQKQQDLRCWTHQFIKRCDHIIREFSQLLTQAKLTSSEAQLLKKLLMGD